MVNGNFQPLDIFLPIGISFYTFQSVSYVIDVYWKKLKPTTNILDYAFFLSYFPQLVAGPIVKAHDFIPQINKCKIVSKQEVYTGIWLIMIGLFKKAVIADYISQYNDLVFASPDTYSGFENLMAIYGYTLQIYCDFSGYSDMAIGLARIMGYDFLINFNFPYKAKNITEFWHRWHISLSTWLKEYLYIPLGGNKSFSLFSVISIPLILFLIVIVPGWNFVNFIYLVAVTSIGVLAYIFPKNKAFTFLGWSSIIALIIIFLPANIFAVAYLGIVLFFWIILFIFPDFKNKLQTGINSMLTMLIGGLWHGANWKFVFWGAMHGLALAVHKASKKFLDKIPNNIFSNFFAWFFTFHFVIFLWIFFRTTDIKKEYVVTENINGIEQDVIKTDTIDAFKVSFLMVDRIFTNWDGLQVTDSTKAEVNPDSNLALYGNPIEDESDTKNLKQNKSIVLHFLSVRYLWFILLLIGFLMHSSPTNLNEKIMNVYVKTPYIVKVLIFIVLVQLVIQLKSEDIQPFIYFQF